MNSEQETFLCFKCHVDVTSATIELHECIGINHGQSLLRSLFRSSWINEEVQVSDERAVLAPQIDSQKLKEVTKTL